MLSKIADKESSYLEVYDLQSVRHKIKVLNFTAAGARTSKLDRQCITKPDTLIIEGTEIRLTNDTTLIVSFKEADWYKGRIIRYILDCVNTNQVIDVYRNTLKKSTQGGLSKQEEIKIYSAIPVKVGLYDTTESKESNTIVPKYVMYLSKRYELQSGDRIVISDTTFEVAKVNSFMHVTPGLMEVRFDKDPRWL